MGGCQAACAGGHLVASLKALLQAAVDGPCWTYPGALLSPFWSFFSLFLYILEAGISQTVP